jgi:Protein of unknown function (DUF4232)
MALLVGGTMAAACSSTSNGSATGSTTTRATSSTTTAVSTTTTAVSTSTAAQSQTCQVAQLQITPEQGSGAAGTIEMSVNLTNHGTTACTMFGYPGMQLLDASGNNLPTTVIRGGGPQFLAAAANQGPTTVTLAPQQTAAFSFSYEDVPVGTETTCPTSAHSLITPPGDVTSATVPLVIAPCGAGTIHVSPVYPS